MIFFFSFFFFFPPPLPPSLRDLSCDIFVCVCVCGGELGGGLGRRDSPNSANPVTVSMVGAARMVFLLKRKAKTAKLE